jgi:hypothetical protein
MCNTPIYFYNIHMKHLQHTSKTYETLEIYVCNAYNVNDISLLLGRMEARRRVKSTSVELVGGAELAAPVEKAATDPVEKALVGLHTKRVEREKCAG